MNKKKVGNFYFLGKNRMTKMFLSTVGPKPDDDIKQLGRRYCNVSVSVLIWVCFVIFT